jgi:hypothetical protein
MIRSTCRAAIAVAALAAASGPGIVSLAITNSRAVGNSAVASSVMRSTPGPIGTRLCSALHTGHTGGIGSVWPQ